MDQGIGELIDSIESGKLSTSDKEKKIQHLTYLWKFSDSFSADSKNEVVLKIQEPEDTAIIFRDLDLSEKEKSPVFKNSCATIAPLLNNTSKEGLYYFHLHKQSRNFNKLSLHDLQTELASSINGKMISYQYVKKIIKIPQESIEICIDSIVKECTKEDVLLVINDISTNKQDKKWLVLILDNLQSKCDSFYIEDAILSTAFSCKFEKVFLFDYYKSEVIELTTYAK